MEKKTIIEQFVEVKAVLEEQGQVELAKFIQGRIDVQSKKAENRKPTAKQVENEGLKARIVDTLANADKPMTATDILNTDMVAFVSLPKVTALLTALVKENKVVREVDKKKAFFTVKQ